MLEKSDLPVNEGRGQTGVLEGITAVLTIETEPASINWSLWFPWTTCSGGL